MKRAVIMFVILVLCLILPGTVFHYLSWSGIKPDLAMLWVIYIALHHRTVRGVVYGFFIGLVVDMYLGRYIGLYAIVLAVVALLISYLQQRWYKESLFITMVLVFCLTILGQTLMVLLADTAGLQWSSGDAFKVIMGISLYNSLLVPLTYPIIHRSFTSGFLYKKSKFEQQ